jgi:DNA-binding NtrC family response regulator
LELKRILVVDDEPDVLSALAELLAMCHVEKASSFMEAKELLETQFFDIAILDIMGVDGYELLEIAKKHDVIPVMLTAHALTKDNLFKSFHNGAASYIPMEKMSDIVLLLNDILEARDKGKHPWWRWFNRLGSYMDKTFGPDWKEEDKEFWKTTGVWWE